MVKSEFCNVTFAKFLFLTLCYNYLRYQHQENPQNVTVSYPNFVKIHGLWIKDIRTDGKLSQNITSLVDTVTRNDMYNSATSYELQVLDNTHDQSISHLRNTRNDDGRKTRLSWQDGQYIAEKWRQQRHVHSTMQHQYINNILHW